MTFAAGVEGCAGPPMVLLAYTLWTFRCSSNQIEPFGDELAEAVDVQMPWEPHPMRRHERLMGVGPLWFDITPVTNGQYAEFLAESGWRPPVSEQNWLATWNWGRNDLPTVPEGDEWLPVNWVSRDDAEAYCEYYEKRLPETWEWQVQCSTLSSLYCLFRVCIHTFNHNKADHGSGLAVCCSTR